MVPPWPRQPPELMIEIVEEILLARAALICKPWRRLLSDHAFRRWYRAFH
jgi:hypothetical protein